MSDPQQIDRDLREYLEKEPNLRREDRLVYLKSIFNKHLEFGQLGHMINRSDLYEIMSNAKNFFTKTSFPIKVSGNELYPGEESNVLVIESVLSYLNKSNLLKKIIKIDYR